jgi:hypothetical protein
MSKKKTATVIEERDFSRQGAHNAHQSPRQHPLHRVRLTGTRGIACATLQNVFAAGILLFYSRTILGTVIRAFAGA